MPTVTRLLQDHVTLTCECIDRIYLNGYVSTLQTSGQLCHFYGEHRGNSVVSPALCAQDTTRLGQAVNAFAIRHRIPVVHFPKGARKEEIARRYLARYLGVEGIVLIGVAQERMRGFRASQVAPGQFRVCLSREQQTGQQQVCVAGRPTDELKGYPAQSDPGRARRHG